MGQEQSSDPGKGGLRPPASRKGSVSKSKSRSKSSRGILDALKLPEPGTTDTRISSDSAPRSSAPESALVQRDSADTETVEEIIPQAGTATIMKPISVSDVWSLYKQKAILGNGGYSTVYIVTQDEKSKKKLQKKLLPTSSAIVGGISAAAAAFGTLKAVRRPSKHKRIPSAPEVALSFEVLSAATEAKKQKKMKKKKSSGEELKVEEPEFEYAMKVLTPDKLEIFESEVKIIQQLQGHPGVVKFYSALSDKRGHYIITEVLRGGEIFDSLADATRTDEKTALSEKVVSDTVKQMLEVVGFMHDNGFVHLDLKPENFLFDAAHHEKQVLKLIDFGSAKPVEDDKLYDNFMGTLLYASPDMIGQFAKCSGKVLKKCDMWAIGVIVFTMITGFSPFKRSVEAKIREAIYKVDYKFPEDVIISDALKDFLSKLLVAEPEKRMSCEEALRHPWLSKDFEASTTAFSSKVLAGLITLQSQSKLKRSLARLLFLKLGKSNREDYTKMFAQIDRDKSGLLDDSEIAEMLMDGLEITRPEAETKAKELMMEIGKRGEEKAGIDEDRFIEAHILGCLSTDQKMIEEAFHMLDSNRNGDLSVSELEKFFGENPEVLSVKLTRSGDLKDKKLKGLSLAVSVVKMADKDGDGKIQLSEFVEFMKSGDKPAAILANLAEMVGGIPEVEKEDESTKRVSEAVGWKAVEESSCMSVEKE